MPCRCWGKKKPYGATQRVCSKIRAHPRGVTLEMCGRIRLCRYVRLQGGKTAKHLVGGLRIIFQHLRYSLQSSTAFSSIGSSRKGQAMLDPQYLLQCLTKSLRGRGFCSDRRIALSKGDDTVKAYCIHMRVTVFLN